MSKPRPNPQTEHVGLISRETLVVPLVISVRTDRPGVNARLTKWRRKHRGVPWSFLLAQGLDKVLPRSGKENGA